MRKHGFPQFPDPLTTYGPGFTLGREEYFPDISTTEFAVASVQAGRQGLRSAASLTSSIGEQHAATVATRR